MKQKNEVPIMSYCTATYRLYDDRADFHKKAESIAVGLTAGINRFFGTAAQFGGMAGEINRI